MPVDRQERILITSKIKPPTAHGRNCYCGLWESAPRLLKDQGIPEGYCGICSICGKPGHTRHFPGALPITAAWCDKHFWYLRVFHPKGSVGLFLWLGIAVIGVAGLGFFLFLV